MVARIFANGLSKALGQSVIVESKTGASGTTAAALVARAAPDGYTLMVIPSGHATAAATFAKLPYRSIDDFHHDQYCVGISVRTWSQTLRAGFRASPNSSVLRVRGRSHCSTARQEPGQVRISLSSCSRSRQR